METKNPVGRPRAITPEIIEKLKDAFKLGCTNEEACYYAEIGKSTFYDFIKEYPEISEEFNECKHYEKIKARMVIHNALEHNDKDTAKWYLERKAKDEFSTKVEMKHSGEINNPYANLSTEELRELIKQGAGSDG